MIDSYLAINLWEKREMARATPKVAFMLRLDPELHERLSLESIASGLSMTEVARAAITHELCPLSRCAECKVRDTCPRIESELSFVEIEDGGLDVEGGGGTG